MNKRSEFDEMRVENGLFKRKLVNKEDSEKYRKLIDANKDLPDNITYDSYLGCFFEKELKTDFTEKEIMEYIGYKQIKLLSTIRNCIVFFTICYILGLVYLVIISLSL